MIILMDRNASNASNESLSALYVKNMYDSIIIMRQHNAIIAEVVKEKPELEILITDALDAPFLVQNCQRPGKMHRVEKLVDIWEYYEQVPALRTGFIGRSRTTSLRSYTNTMCRSHSLAKRSNCQIHIQQECASFRNCTLWMHSANRTSCCPSSWRSAM